VTHTDSVCVCDSVTATAMLLVPVLPSVMVADGAMEISGGSSSAMVMSPPGAAAIVALLGLLSTTVKCSLASASVSPRIGMVIGSLVSPGTKVTVPDDAT